MNLHIRLLVVVGLVILPLSGCASDGQEEVEKDMLEWEEGSDSSRASNDETMSILTELTASEDETEDGMPTEDDAPFAETIRSALPRLTETSTLENDLSMESNSSLATVKSWALAVRAQPHLQAQVVTYLHHSDEVAVLEERPDGWTRISGNLYVRSKYLTGVRQPDQSLQGGLPFRVRSRALYIRAHPDHTSPIMGVLLQGETIRVRESVSGWSKIGPQQFVRSRYLEPLGH